jgi:hypothetical protein
MEAVMSELSHFEELSAKTPLKGPIAIIVGSIVLPIILYLLSLITPTEAVSDLKKAGQEGPAEASSQQDVEDDL